MAPPDISLGLAPGPLVALLLSAILAGLARGFSGFGAALIFMPLASAVVGPRLAAPLLLVIDALAASGMLPDAWRRSDRRGVGIMALGALAGVPLGTAVLVHVDPLTVRWLVVGIVAALLVLLASGWRYRGRPSTPLTVAVGAVSGLFSGAAQVGGPPVVAYWLGSSAPSANVRANVVLYFAISTVLSGLSYLAGGLVTQAVLLLALVTGPSYAFGLWLGSRLFGRASEATFRRVGLGLIAAAVILGLPVLDNVPR